MYTSTLANKFIMESTPSKGVAFYLFKQILPKIALCYV